MVLFTWRTLEIEIDPTKLYGLDKFEITEGLTTEQKTSGKEAYAKYKSKKPGSIKFSVKMLRGAGVDLDSTVESWRKLCDGTGARAYLGGKDVFGANVMLTDIATQISGFTGDLKMVEANVSLTFTQCAAVNKAKTKTTSSGSGKVKSSTGKSAGVTTGSKAPAYQFHPGAGMAIAVRNTKVTEY